MRHYNVILRMCDVTSQSANRKSSSYRKRSAAQAIRVNLVERKHHGPCILSSRLQKETVANHDNRLCCPLWRCCFSNL